MTDLVIYKEVNLLDVKTILKSFFGFGYATSIQINDKVVKIVWDMISKSKECTDLLNWVPRPTGFLPGPSYIAMQLAHLGRRLATRKITKVSETCKAGVAYGYTTKIRLASQGL